MGCVKYGYARISTEDQNAAMQQTALRQAGCKTIFTDELSGAITKRPTLLRRLKKLEHGDTLTVWKLDRLGRSLRDLITMLDSLRDRRVKFRSITEAIDTETPTGRVNVADDRHGGRVRAQPYHRTDPRRSEGRKETGREIRKEEEAGPGADHQGPEADRGGRTG